MIYISFIYPWARLDKFQNVFCSMLIIKLLFCLYPWQVSVSRLCLANRKSISFYLIFCLLKEFVLSWIYFLSKYSVEFNGKAIWCLGFLGRKEIIIGLVSLDFSPKYLCILDNFFILLAKISNITYNFNIWKIKISQFSNWYNIFSYSWSA